jgi:hypothetical protein
VLARKKSTHLYTYSIQPNWTPIEPIIEDIKISENQSHIITRIQVPIQLIGTKTIHLSQGLSLNELAFDPINVKKNLDYRILFFLAYEQKNDYTY